jgi:hypothetical protein
MPVKAGNRGWSQWDEHAKDREGLRLVSAYAPQPDSPGQPADPERRDRILRKLGQALRDELDHSVVLYPSGFDVRHLYVALTGDHLP